MSKPIVICGFPGIGKTYACRNRSDIIDSDSSEFSWKESEIPPFKVRNPDFPGNYVDYIEEQSKREDLSVILVSSHQEVRDELYNRGIQYVNVIPDIKCKETYLRRYLKRGSPLRFINSLNEFWDSWLNAYDKDPCATITLLSGEYLEDVLPEEKKDKA